MPLISGNIVKNCHAIIAPGPQWIGACTAFIVGILSISALMRLARKVNFGVFLILIGAILAIATISGIID